MTDIAHMTHTRATPAPGLRFRTIALVELGIIMAGGIAFVWASQFVAAEAIRTTLEILYAR